MMDIIRSGKGQFLKGAISFKKGVEEVERFIVECVVCKKSLRRQKSRIRGKIACSIECRGELNRIIRNSGQFVKGKTSWNKGLPSPWTSERNRQNKGRPNFNLRKRTDVLCINCHKKFERKNAYIREKMFCSHPCYAAHPKEKRWREDQAIRTSNSQKLLWSNPEHKKRMLPIFQGKQRELWKDPSWADSRKATMKKYWDNDERRKKARDRMLGANSPNWKGGKSYEIYPPEFTNGLREAIRMRDGYKCQMCGCSQLENGRSLPVHHKDQNKNNCSMINLTALCDSCHIRTHWKLRKEKI